MNDDSSLARNSAAAASSLGSPQRFIGCGGAGVRSGGTGSSSPRQARPVQVMPGQMALTRTPTVA